MNPYAVLELQPGASQDEVRKAYRRLSMIYHPDRKPLGNTVKFQELKAAYKALTTPAPPKGFGQSTPHAGTKQGFGSPT